MRSACWCPEISFDMVSFPRSQKNWVYFRNMAGRTYMETPTQVPQLVSACKVRSSISSSPPPVVYRGKVHWGEQPDFLLCSSRSFFQAKVTTPLSLFLSLDMSPGSLCMPRKSLLKPRGYKRSRTAQHESLIDVHTNLIPVFEWCHTVPHMEPSQPPITKSAPSSSEVDSPQNLKRKREEPFSM
jgi:hypothetical protein